MSAMVRLAGRLDLGDGTRLVWSVADGRRGRRWRATTTHDGSLTGGLLLEVGLDGRPARLELSTVEGLLTLHPESAGHSLHGNVVTVDGVRHLAFAWSIDHALSIDGEPVADAVTAHRLAGSVAVGEGRRVPVVAVERYLGVREDERRFVRVSTTDWRIEAGDKSQILSIEDRGLLLSGEAGQRWPLEIEPPGSPAHGGQAVDKPAPNAHVR